MLLRGITILYYRGVVAHLVFVTALVRLDILVFMCVQELLEFQGWRRTREGLIILLLLLRTSFGRRTWRCLFLLLINVHLMLIILALILLLLHRLPMAAALHATMFIILHCFYLINNVIINYFDFRKRQLKNIQSKCFSSWMDLIFV